MVQALEHIGEGHGDSARWDEVWSDLESDQVQAFTRAAPRTLQQFWQRCYFEDLWEISGKRRPGGRFLEQGSGRGTTSMYLASRGCDVTMLDLSAHAFEVAAANFARESLPLPTFVVGDARDTGLPSESYDCIYNIGLLEHFDDPEPVLAEAVRLLRPGGWLFMVIVPRVPARNAWLVKLLFRPWSLLPSGLKKRAKRVLGGGETDTNVDIATEMTRTELGPSTYLAALARLGVVEAACVPYNPYHQIYLRRWQERWMAVPLFHLHHAAKRAVCRAPWLRTAQGLAGSLLLTCRKPESC